MVTRLRSSIISCVGVLVIACLMLKFNQWGAADHVPANTEIIVQPKEHASPSHPKAVERPTTGYDTDYIVPPIAKPSHERYELSRSASPLEHGERAAYVLSIVNRAYPDMPQSAAETVATVFTNELARQLPQLNQSEEMLLLKSIDAALYPQLKALPMGRSSAHFDWSIDRLELIASKWGVVFGELMHERPPESNAASLDEISGIAREYYTRICGNPAGYAQLEQFEADSKASAECYFSPDGKYGLAKDSVDRLKQDLEAVIEQSKRSITERITALETNKAQTAEEKEKQMLLIMSSEAVNVFPAIRTAVARSTPEKVWERVQLQLSKQNYENRLKELSQRKSHIDKEYLYAVRDNWAREAQRVNLVADMRRTLEEHTEETSRNMK